MIVRENSDLQCCQYLLTAKEKRKKDRYEQDSNLRGKIPLDFKSNALTTRPS